MSREFFYSVWNKYKNKITKGIVNSKIPRDLRNRLIYCYFMRPILNHSHYINIKCICYRGTLNVLKTGNLILMFLMHNYEWKICLWNVVSANLKKKWIIRIFSTLKLTLNVLVSTTLSIFLWLPPTSRMESSSTYWQQ